MKNVIHNLIEESQKFLFKRAKIDDKIGLEAANFAVRDIPKPIGKFEKSDSPLIRYIGEAIKHGNPETADLLKALEPALPYLPWKYNYEPRPDMPDLADQMGWGEILGPEAPYHDEHFYKCKSFFSFHKPLLSLLNYNITTILFQEKK